MAKRKPAKRKPKCVYNAVDLFSGCGGLTLGMRQAGFFTKVAVENDEMAVKAYKLNHPTTFVIHKDIRKIAPDEILQQFNGEPVHLLAGCPPCQGFSSIRRLNRSTCVADDRNNLVLDFLRMVQGLKPMTIMMENVPGLQNYRHFEDVLAKLRKIGYCLQVKVLNVKDFGVPQSRRRLVMMGSLKGAIEIAQPSDERATVRDAIFGLESPEGSKDDLHKIIPTHTKQVYERIRLTPKDGGSRTDLPEKFTLNCHKKPGVGFNDIYGRLRWDDYSSTITGGCLNPSKGRFLHPEQDRVITPREAALLQSFPRDYKFPVDMPKQALALLIGNALPPQFSFHQSRSIASHLSQFC